MYISKNIQKGRNANKLYNNNFMYLVIIFFLIYSYMYSFLHRIVTSKWEVYYMRLETDVTRGFLVSLITLQL